MAMQVPLAGPSQPQQNGAIATIGIQSQTAGYAQPPPPVYQPPTAYGYKPGTETLYQPAYNALPPPYGSWQQQHQQQQIAGPSTSAMPQVQNIQTVQVTVANAPMPIGPPVMQPVIITQPTPTIIIPPSYLGWSVFNFLCCFWPLGLAALVYSVKVGSARSAEEARSYSMTARNLNVAATALAPILIIFVVAAVVGGGAATRASKSYDNYDYYDSYLYYYSSLTTYSYVVYGTSYYGDSYFYTVYAYTYTLSYYVG